MLTTMCIMGPYTILQNVFSSDLPDQKLGSSISGCDAKNNSGLDEYFEPVSTFSFKSSDWKDRDDSAGIRMLSMSYMWYAGLTTSMTVFFGIIYTIVQRKYLQRKYPDLEERKIDANCISPPLLKLWRKFFPQLMQEIVFDNSYNNFSSTNEDNKTQLN